ncbi:MAG: hypothetical protein IKG67_02365, partial [Parasporobacterium sp.]|nr:hypothetical protein [Parasporobacterium sp.]
PEDIYGADQFRCPRSAGGHCQAATAAGSLGYQGSMPKGNLHTILDLTYNVFLYGQFSILKNRASILKSCLYPKKE